jgi:hypothetical protein
MSEIDRQDRINELAQKLSAMLTMTCGECAESFRRTSDDIQDNFMWACADMARQLRDLVSGRSEVSLATDEVGHA